jgi:hypothetical protein
VDHLFVANGIAYAFQYDQDDVEGKMHVERPPEWQSLPPRSIEQLTFDLARLDYNLTTKWWDAVPRHPRRSPAPQLLWLRKGEGGLCSSGLFRASPRSSIHRAMCPTQLRGSALSAAVVGTEARLPQAKPGKGEITPVCLDYG